MMKLESIRYHQFHGTDREWCLQDCSFGDINLIVGRNASGKTRTLNIIHALARMLSGEVKPQFLSGSYTANFRDGKQEIVYVLEYEDRRVTRESLSINGTVLLDRRKEGRGKIYAQRMKKMIEFQMPDGDLACVSRRDALQHPFFERLHSWGKSLRIYRFGTTLGKDCYLIFEKGAKGIEVNPRDAQSVVALLKNGELRFHRKFMESIRRDMRLVGYDLEKVRIGPLLSITVEGEIGSRTNGLVVKERDLASVTDQNDMSQGMFRCLSLIIQLDYAGLSGDAACILIDDIGEGLDYERSVALIRLVVAKAKRSGTQLIMSTNDRFVMNSVPLEHWSVAHREGNHVRMLNFRNSRQLFEDFEVTGLSNFDFFAGGLPDDGDQR